VLVGVGTALADDPALNVREFPVVNQPIKMVLDPNARLSSAIRSANPPKFAAEGKWIHWTAKSDPGQESIDETGQILPSVPLMGDAQVDWDAFRATLFQLGITSCLIEGGSVTLSSAIRQNCVNRLELFVAPKLFGAGKDWFHIGEPFSPKSIDQVTAHRVSGVSVIGEDIWVTVQMQTPQRDG
jgi:diaminohydroxyphosphoribosylaminopyrimidine deaminase/5-amino-6-(5-phosphoribosylamino)uracil reductase